jgi:hypothetical protein
MSHDTVEVATPPVSAPPSRKKEWARVIFTGMTPGSPACVTFQIVVTLKSGKQRHLSQTVRVTDSNLLLRIAALAPGTEIRVCTETDWAAEGIPTVLKDFCPV